MEHLLPAELEQRAKDIYLNLLVLTKDAKIGLPPMTPETTRWLDLWSHVLEEFHLRFGSYPAGFTNGFIRDVMIPRPDLPIAQRAAATVRRTSVPDGGYLVKYGKYRYLKDTIEKGILRISHASYYSDPSLNHAIRDNELEFSVHRASEKTVLRFFDGKTGAPKGTFSGPIPITVSRRSETDYYVYCLSSVLAPRLFLDFEADACLIIRDQQRFEAGLIEAVRTQLPAWDCGRGPVSYIDPLNMRWAEVDPFTCKHFRYAYQREYRMVWLPPAIENNLQPIYVTVAGLSEYCEFVPLLDS